MSHYNFSKNLSDLAAEGKKEASIIPTAPPAHEAAVTVVFLKTTSSTLVVVDLVPVDVWRAKNSRVIVFGVVERFARDFELALFAVRTLARHEPAEREVADKQADKCQNKPRCHTLEQVFEAKIFLRLIGVDNDGV
ncbi:MAG: hypothetical protein LDLANPLL_02119 [Turneriella sp.]|nr:hypothetical protein [Turneriella sp.]